MGSLTIMPIRLEMVTSRGQFADKIIRGMLKELQKKLNSNAFMTSLRRGVQKILEASLISQPTYQDMVAQDGRLRAELGVVDSVAAMNGLVRDWVNSTQVTIARPRIVGGRIAGTIIVVRAIQADYQDVLNRAYASYTTEKGDDIPWLQWLLTEGQSILVSTHMAEKKPSAPQSRTRTNTIMVKTKGQGWGVPEEYSGVPENNYATQAVAKAIPEIEAMFISETQRRF